ncbi:DNA-directed RNA polymerase I subunit RPA34.5-domain-containing protein [Xylaria sp. FL0043]|nr:DNA-directed RNA polymerase I subunit RPA34.5-domain-containing protein [Xylaria sp. FL0043]
MRTSKANIGSLSSMANKVRQEKNGASAKAKAPLARAREAKKPFKSADKVEDSDSDSDSASASGNADDSVDDEAFEAARAKFLAGQAAKRSKPAETKAKTNGVKPTTTPAKPAPKERVPTSAQKPADDSASDSESGSGSESDSSPDKTPSSSHRLVAEQNKASANRAKSPSKSSSDSTSSSGSESESEEEASTQNKAAKNKASPSEESEESDNGSDDEAAPSTAPQVSAKGTAKNTVSAAQESSSEESDDEDEDDGDRMAVDKTNSNNTAAELASQTSRTPWLNNGDFMLRKASSDNPGKEVADFFSNANLEGKQVWYFTAPASLPITVLKDMEIDPSKATRGEPLLTHNGDNYILDLESRATNTQIQLLIPSRGGDKYASLNHGIDSTVHLRRMAKFGPGGEVYATATENYVPVPKPIRQQPEDLRVRYTPIGVPTPAIPSAVPTKKTAVNASSSQAKTKASPQSSSSSDSESDSESDVEMTTPTASIVPASQTKPVKSDLTNGDRKRKHAGEQDQAAKRQKAGKPAEIPNAKKETVAPAANSSATPSKKPSTKPKEKKEKAKKEKTPKSAVMTPTTTKQTPIPLPSYPGMKR